MKGCKSKEIGLFHDTNKLLLVDFSVSVTIGLIDHLLELLVSHCFAQFSCDSLQILQRDLASAVIIEKSKSLEDLLSWISLCDFASHQLHEICEFNDSFSLSIHFGDHLLDFLLLGLEAKSSHGNLEFLGVDIT